MSEPEAKTKTVGFLYKGKKWKIQETPKWNDRTKWRLANGGKDNEKIVMLEMEAEMGPQITNCETGEYLWTILTEMGH